MLERAQQFIPQCNTATIADAEFENPLRTISYRRKEALVLFDQRTALHQLETVVAWCEPGVGPKSQPKDEIPNADPFGLPFWCGKPTHRGLLLVPQTAAIVRQVTRCV